MGFSDGGSKHVGQAGGERGRGNWVLILIYEEKELERQFGSLA